MKTSGAKALFSVRLCGTAKDAEITLVSVNPCPPGKPFMRGMQGSLRTVVGGRTIGTLDSPTPGAYRRENPRAEGEPVPNDGDRVRVRAETPAPPFGIAPQGKPAFGKERARQPVWLPGPCRPIPNVDLGDLSF